ncbi:L-Ala-D/L-amino acid epimerase isoform X2 [Phalaenopsis equestris]|uniref:L-Ala-D/L-amino acid epimerase isoform X2 n=1 Tax=Phalaenopsis equestris TaxID=78828 RepID=UPI0009E2249D|nr:L-Ala-D/L-amino acid epimerase isoform X2 [Phalaenopsis equestris]
MLDFTRVNDSPTSCSHLTSIFPAAFTLPSSDGANELPILVVPSMNRLVSPSHRSFLSPSLLKNPILSRRCSLRFNAGSTLADTMSAGGFDDLKATFSVDVCRADGRPLNVPLIAPFTIASSSLDTVGNVAVRVELRGGGNGWGEAPVLPSVTVEDQHSALETVADICGFLVNRQPIVLGSLLTEINGLLPGHSFASVRAGIEMALIDAVANSINVPLWKLFGGASKSIVTDITIPIVAPNEAAKLAAKYKERGFSTLKLKVGKNLSSDVEVLKAIRIVHPDCSFILDANEGYTANEAIEVLEKLNEMGVTPALFEQPVHRDNWEGLHHVTQVAKGKYGVSVAADESCRSLEDAKRIIEGNLAHVINIKLAKLGVLGALDVIQVARAAGTKLMIGGMVETRLAMGFAGHLAAGLGCFNGFFCLLASHVGTLTLIHLFYYQKIR